METSDGRGLLRRLRKAALALGCAVALLGAGPLQGTVIAADEFPARPIRIVVPFPPGAITDAMSRILAAELGKVIGQSVIVDHGHGVSSVYIHMSRTDVVLGQKREAGDPIGAIGMTGRASGPHLHWGLNWFEVKLDPALVAP